VLSRKVPELILALFVSAILLLVSSTLIYAIEGSEYPDFDSISKALYWSAMTVTTVGYGDVVPHTTGGRVIASFVAFLGVCLFALPSAVLGSGLIEVMTEGRHKAYVERQRERTRARKLRQRGRQNRSGGRPSGAAIRSAGKRPSFKAGGRGSGGGGGGGGGSGAGRGAGRGGGSGMRGGDGVSMGGMGAKVASAGRALEMTSTQIGRGSLSRRESLESVDSETGLDSPYGKSPLSSPKFAVHRRGAGSGVSGEESLPTFSQVFDVHNPTHIVAAAAVLLGEDSEIYHTQRGREGMIVPSGFWEQFGPETGGLVGLHAVLTRKLAEEFLFQSIKLGVADEEEEGEEENSDSEGGGLGVGLAGGGDGQGGDHGFFKL
jgi:hypothetical protein